MTGSNKCENTQHNLLQQYIKHCSLTAQYLTCCTFFMEYANTHIIVADSNKGENKSSQYYVFQVQAVCNNSTKYNDHAHTSVLLLL